MVGAQGLELGLHGIVDDIGAGEQVALDGVDDVVLRPQDPTHHLARLGHRSAVD